MRKEPKRNRLSSSTTRKSHSLSRSREAMRCFSTLPLRTSSSNRSILTSAPGFLRTRTCTASGSTVMPCAWEPKITHVPCGIEMHMVFLRIPTCMGLILFITTTAASRVPMLCSCSTPMAWTSRSIGRRMTSSISNTTSLAASSIFTSWLDQLQRKPAPNMLELLAVLPCRATGPLV